MRNVPGTAHAQLRRPLGWVLPLLIVGAALLLVWSQPLLERLLLLLAMAGTAFAIFRLVRPPLRVVVIGDPEFSAWVGEMAKRSDRQVVRSLHPNTPAPAVATLDAVPDYDELVIEAGLFDRLDGIGTHLRDRAPRLLPIHRNGRSPFDSGLPYAARCGKRVFDLLVVLCALPLALLVALIVSLAIRLESTGPAVFSQVRVGADGRRFRLYKFRTMKPGCDDKEHSEYVASLIRGEDVQQHRGMFKLADDPRVTRVGRILRRYSLDELPQLWNVIRGDMSLVGPRPPLPRETGLYDLAAWQRLRVKPGLTGLWQVSGRCELTFREMVDLDVTYWRSWSPLLDLRILAHTPVAVVSGKGAS